MAVMTHTTTLARITFAILFACTCLFAVPAVQAAGQAVSTVENAGAYGGLCVQIGAQESQFAGDLAQTGRYLVHVLDDDAAAVAAARRELAARNVYGMVSLEQRPAGAPLPYSENLVNLLVMFERPRKALSAREISRVLTPNAVVLVASGVMSEENLKAIGLEDVRSIKTDRTWLVGRKPWAKEMDGWSHPRHSASGNAVSNDVAVGPPRRVRWVVAAQSEVAGMVSADGRNFYAGALARDSFNGLRLWHRDLVRPNASQTFTMRSISRNSASPVTDGKHLFAVVAKKLLALDAVSGRTVREFPNPSEPNKVLVHEGTLLAINKDSLRAFNVATGNLLWTHEAEEPRHVVMEDKLVALVQGNTRRGDKPTTLVLDRVSGAIRWKRSDLDWLPMVTRTVSHADVVAYEVSTHNDEGPNNAIHILSAIDGATKLDHPFLPGMNHRRQARAMFVNNELWLLHGGKNAEKKKLPIQISSIDIETGKTLKTHPAGLAHCFPPVATPKFLFAGEMDLTNLYSGEVDAQQITKAACSQDFGWVPANGLIYVTPKHCVCWPMLRGYAALAPARAGGNAALMNVKDMTFPLEKGVDAPSVEKADAQEPWPSYRGDAWRSASTSQAGPTELETLWSVSLSDIRDAVGGPITADWDENPFIKGSVTAPVVAQGNVYLARPDAHEVLSLDAASGKPQWRFTANGRVDTTPTIHRGLCLFGTKAGWVYCLRADDGRLVWRMRAAPTEERIVAYGQLESPWPVPGSVLVVDGVAYFAAGRQSLADGGILVFAVQPESGKLHWVERLDSVPQKGFYRSSGLEFDNFDLLHREGDSVAMSRWLFDRKTGEMSVDPWKAFAKLNTGNAAAMVPQGTWSYAPRHQKRTKTHTERRPLVTFRDNVLFGSTQDKRGLYRRDFDLKNDEEFDTKWLTGWAAGQASHKEGEIAWRSQRLAEKAKWSVNVVDEKDKDTTIDGVVLAKENLYVATSDGQLRIVSTTDGKTVSQRGELPILWDAMAIAGNRLFATTRDGRVVCLGKK